MLRSRKQTHPANHVSHTQHVMNEMNKQVYEKKRSILERNTKTNCHFLLPVEIINNFPPPEKKVPLGWVVVVASPQVERK